MLSALLHLIPLAAAAAMSTIPMMTMIVMLLSPRRTRIALPYVIGWTLGILITVSLATLGTELVPAGGHPSQHDDLLDYAETFLGVILILSAGYSLWRARGKSSDTLPKWMLAMESLSGWAAFGVGLLFNLRPKGILLAIAAGVVLRREQLSFGDTAVALVVYTLVAASTILVPVVITLVAPDRMHKPLTATRDWLQHHRVMVSAGILLTIGVLLIGDGIYRLIT